MGSLESDTTERLHFHFSLSCIGEGNGNPLQCSCLENPRDGGAWRAAVYGVTQSWTRLKRRSSSCLGHLCIRSPASVFYFLGEVTWCWRVTWQQKDVLTSGRACQSVELEPVFAELDRILSGGRWNTKIAALFEVAQCPRAVPLLGTGPEERSCPAGAVTWAGGSRPRPPCRKRAQVKHADLTLFSSSSW